MTLLTEEELRKRVETDADASVLISLLAAEEAEIDRLLGPAGPTAELMRAHGPLLMLSYQAESVTSITENGRAVASDEYELRPGGQQVMRLHRRAWHGLLDIAYIRIDDLEQRKNAQAALIALDLDHRPGVTVSRIGEWEERYTPDVDIALARAAILATLAPAVVLF